VKVDVTGQVKDVGLGADRTSGTYTVVDDNEISKGDFKINADGAYSFTVHLKIKSKGKEMLPRQINVTVKAKDNAGNEGSASLIVSVP